jgi:hypothetical protein
MAMKIGLMRSCIHTLAVPASSPACDPFKSDSV